MNLNQFFSQLIKYLLEWLQELWREAKTEANLNSEISKYHKAAEELDPQPQAEFKENGVFGEEGWYIELSHPAFTNSQPLDEKTQTQQKVSHQ
jgi:trehalose/maltose hydrolase-like predicted phosphorylase